MFALESQGQAEIDAYIITADRKYSDLAIDSLLKIEKAGPATFSTYNNLVIMYYYSERFDEEKELLEMLEEKYPNNYVVYMRRAQYEIAIQNLKENSERNYLTFDEYYQKAMELYEKSEGGERNDPEMQALAVAYQDVVDGHWLD